MKAKLLSMISVLLMCVSLTACALYDKDYYSESDYQIEAKKDPDNTGTVTVLNETELENAIVSIIEGNADSNKIVFSTDYDGDETSDISLACKRINTGNPLCAYCVESIDYDIYKVVAYYEAVINVHFADSAVSIEDIIRPSYAGAIGGTVSQAMKDGVERIAVLVNRSSYDSDDIVEMAQDIYYRDPLCVPCEPRFTVNMFSGASLQRLYEINIDYVVSQDEFKEYKSFIDSFHPFSFDKDGPEALSELEMCAGITSYIVENCSAASESGRNSAYYALSKGEADSKGLSLAFVALCEMNGLECKLVRGQRDWVNHYWNIIKIDGDYYHVDIERCITEDIKSGFMLNDDNMWQSYRWNLSGYPQCSGSLSYNPALFPDIGSSGEKTIEDNTEE